MAKASFVVSMGPIGQPIEAQGHRDQAKLIDQFRIVGWSEDGNITQDISDALRLHIVVQSPDPADVRAFIEAMYGNLLSAESRHEVDRQLG